MSLPLVYTCLKGNPLKIQCVHIGLLDPEEIKRISVVKVVESAICEKGLPKRGGRLSNYFLQKE